MPSQVSDDSLSQAVFHSVTDGGYPEDEKVITSELSSVAVNSLSQLLEQAREEVKSSIRELSRLSAQDIDGWITQARQLRNDIDSSERQAAEIVNLAEKGKEAEAQRQNAHDKVTLLRTEVSFNERLLNTLQRVQDVKQTVNVAQEAVIGGNLEEGTRLLQESRKQLAELQGCDNTQLTGLIEAKLTDLENTLAEAATKHWKNLIQTDHDHGRITVSTEGSGGTTIESVDRVLDGLDLLRPKIIGLKKDLDTAILMPRLQSRPNTSRIIVEGDSITTATEKSPLTITALLDDLENNLFTYLINTLPPCVVEPLSAIFIPGLVSRLIGGPLSSSVPPDLSGLMHFDSTLDRVRAFADALDKHGWPWSDELRRWADDSSNVWLARRSDGSLHSVRQLLLRGLGKPRSVERVETQTIAQENDVFEGHDKANDWNAGWSDDGEGGGVARTEPRSKSETTHGDDDEDTSAWGWDENDNEDAEQAADERDADSTNDVEDDAEDAWGAWDVDDDQKQDSPIMTKKPAVSPKKTHKRGQSKANGSVSRPPPPPQMEREVTLREAYFITALPEQMLEIIVQAVEDADTLSRSDHTANPVTPAATGLFKLPCLLLGMYRACAPTFYTHDVNGNMYLYNDCLYLAEQLRLFTEHYDSRNGASDLAHSGLYDEMSALETFGKGAYRKEMESQRTILGDLLDGTEEFKNCTEQPFADICDGAVSATIDRLRQVNAQFAEVLAPSALLQSTGSLLSTVTSKVIVNIEDMSDISEPESQRLALFCRRISALQDLFTPGQVVGEENDSQQAAVAAAVYVQQWWKFQYLAEVLESSLADIKYLWMEGELSLEFDTEEIVDLIEALFADSDHRRKAILDIRRSGRRG